MRGKRGQEPFLLDCCRRSRTLWEHSHVRTPEQECTSCQEHNEQRSAGWSITC